MSLHLVCLIDKNNKRHLQLEVVSQKQGGVGMVSLREENIVFYLVSSLIFGRFPFHIFSFSPPAWFQLFLSLFCWSGYSLYLLLTGSPFPFRYWYIVSCGLFLCVPQFYCPVYVTWFNTAICKLDFPFVKFRYVS